MRPVLTFCARALLLAIRKLRVRSCLPWVLVSKSKLSEHDGAPWNGALQHNYTDHVAGMPAISGPKAQAMHAEASVVTLGG